MDRVGVPTSIETHISKPVVSSLIQLARPKQWTKNLLVFAGVLFAGLVTDPTSISRVFIAFMAMCLTSSATYVFNDIADRLKDKAHPKKQFRPVASGDIAVPMAKAFGAALLIVGLALSLLLGWGTFIIVLVYILIQIAYNGWLKRLAVADVFVIATGFILRAVLGAEAIHVAVSGWLLFCTGALSLMLGFAKRREEFLSMGHDLGSTRQSLSQYNRATLDVFVSMFAGVAVMSYGIYSLDSPTAKHYPALILTAPFVMYGVSRYLMLVFAEGEGGEPADILLRDRHIIFSVVGFLVAALVALARNPIPLIER